MHPRRQFPNLASEGYTSGLSFMEMKCDAISCLFLVQYGGTSFHLQSPWWMRCHCPWQHAVKANGNKLSDIPKSLSPILQHDECMNFLLTVFRCGTFWLATARLISDVCVSIFDVFHPSSNTAGSHEGISTHTKKLPIDVCSLDVLHHGTLVKQQVI
jgi:hypothetical protein